MTELLRYHILQYQVDVKRLAVGSPLYAKTLLTNSSWATVTDGERVIMIRQSTFKPRGESLPLMSRPCFGDLRV